MKPCDVWASDGVASAMLHEPQQVFSNLVANVKEGVHRAPLDLAKLADLYSAPGDLYAAKFAQLHGLVRMKGSKLRRASHENDLPMEDTFASTPSDAVCFPRQL
mmetsp:Transcript_75658/g.133552  ORF Transcript_75658/g.133552 Transcript_75658/m.133552 type:complete len:104 (-) Transcript_75658:359-670(-)